MSLENEKENLPPDREYKNPHREPRDSFNKLHASDDDDDELISQAYDLFVTQCTGNGDNIQRPQIDLDVFPETCDTNKNKPVAEVDYLEDLVTLEDLRDAISPFIANFELPDVPEEDELLFNDNLGLSEASTIANVTVMNLFGRCWNVITNKHEAMEVANTALTEIFNRAWKCIKPHSRWREPDPSSWKRNVAKKRRADGLPYVTASKIRRAKVPKAIDCSTCKQRCTAKISADDRDRLCRTYWALSFAERKNFILNLIKVNPIKTIVVNRKRATPRSSTKRCFFKINGLEIPVCQLFFCRTLCISPAVITDAVTKSTNLGLYSKTIDPRGRHEPKNKTSALQVQEVHDHINSFPTMESHYVRKNTKRKYLDASLSIYKMYKLYEEECQNNGSSPVSEATYRKIFCTDFNLGFFVPKTDQCLVCTKYDRLLGDDKLAMEQEYQDHINRKNSCNEEKDKDKKRAESDKSFLSASFDLQAILQIPSGDVGLLYYCRKLIVYNLTIYESAAPNDAFCFAWNEINGKRGSSEIGSVILHYLSQIPDSYKEVSLFSDTCGGQNRNQQMAAALLWAVHTIPHINVIEHKFLESGHSYMEVDSMHSCIESAKKHTNVYAMNEWLNIFRRARTSRKTKKQGKKPYNVKELKFNDFKDLKMLSSRILKDKKKTSDGRPIKWLKIKRMKYVKGESRIYYSYDMNEDYLYMDLDVQGMPHPVPDSLESRQTHSYSTRQSKRIRQEAAVIDSPQPEQGTSATFPTQLNQLYSTTLSISSAKKADLIKLCEKGVIPEEYHGWYRQIKTDRQSTDRVPDLTASDESDEWTDN